MRAPATFPDEPEPERPLSFSYTGGFVAWYGCPTGRHIFSPPPSPGFPLQRCWCGSGQVPFITTCSAKVLVTTSTTSVPR